jgi:hypothetical protein
MNLKELAMSSKTYHVSLTLAIITLIQFFTFFIFLVLYHHCFIPVAIFYFICGKYRHRYYCFFLFYLWVWFVCDAVTLLR